MHSKRKNEESELFDESAITELVKQHHGGMLRLARSIVGPAYAEEVTQEAWIKILRGIKDFQGRSQIKTWILRIVSNQAASLLRKQSRRPEMVSGSDADYQFDQRFDSQGAWSTPPTTWTAGTPEELLARDELRTLLLQQIQLLPPMQRAVFTLRDVEGLEYAEIASILDTSLGNIRVMLHRARSQLWKCVEHYENSESN